MLATGAAPLVRPRSECLTGDVAAAPGHLAEVRRLVFDHLSDEDVARLGEITAKRLPALTS
ncbi:hypothetical protein GCM10011609_23860 [Lentzea pudingi]|uniref:MarR family protein n=1 Tax=Lentzea pudingi TaxID=1789439 RepID=A0ABQ2HMW0_9PSEU|nr:hypothetical protein [Lentzea pudingi]GGM86568.1 hypothetical protein GCM10011609_23860 [Lentzea pudingi]